MARIKMQILHQSVRPALSFVKILLTRQKMFWCLSPACRLASAARGLSRTPEMMGLNGVIDPANFAPIYKLHMGNIHLAIFA
jgi:hypothetical protein